MSQDMVGVQPPIPFRVSGGLLLAGFLLGWVGTMLVCLMLEQGIEKRSGNSQTPRSREHWVRIFLYDRPLDSSIVYFFQCKLL